MTDKRLKIVETVLRDAHQSLAATRMRTEDMLPILEKMDQVGYHAIECWGGATFDACLRFLDEDPWDRLRALRKGKTYYYKVRAYKTIDGSKVKSLRDPCFA